MSLCVVAFPMLPQADRDWLSSIRAQYDPEYRLIQPHVTLLFPTDSVELASLENHVGAVAKNTEPFQIVFRCVLPFRGPFGSKTHLFLVPDEGLSRIAKIHERLYARVFGVQNERSPSFVPHLTIGAFDDGVDCTRVAGQINTGKFEISCIIRKLSIVSGSGAAVIHSELDLKGAC